MDASRYFIINLNVNGRRYPLKILRDQRLEEIYRKASRELDQKINRYKARFLTAYPRAGVRKIEEEDCVIMAAIQATAEKIELEKNTEASDMETQLREMIHELENYLRGEE